MKIGQTLFVLFFLYFCIGMYWIVGVPGKSSIEAMPAWYLLSISILLGYGLDFLVILLPLLQFIRNRFARNRGNIPALMALILYIIPHYFLADVMDTGDGFYQVVLTTLLWVKIASGVTVLIIYAIKISQSRVMVEFGVYT